MINHWKFTPLEYVVGWRAFGWDHLHFPLEEQREESTEPPLIADYVRQCEQAAKVFAEHWGEDLYSAFVTLASPTARLQAFGHVGPDDAKKVRIYAGIRHQAGAVVAQEPRGLIHVYQVPAARVGQRVADALPPMNPGHRPGVEVYLDDLRPRDESDPGAPASWMQSVDNRPSPKQEWQRLTNAPRKGIGQIEVYPGPTLGPRDTGGRRELQWLDVAEDGRYLVTETRRTIAANPADSAGLATRIQQLLTVAAETHAHSGS